jgi:hypothetical protein
MQNHRPTPEQFGVNILKLPRAAETLLDALTSGSVSPAVLLESLYYAADESLFATMRIVASLDDNARAKLLDYAKKLHGDDFALTLLLELPHRPPRNGPAEEGIGAASGFERD